MIDSLQLIFLASVIGYFTYKYYIYPLYLSPLCKIPGPPPDYFLLGNLVQIIKSEVGIPHFAWAEKYGGIVMYRGLLNKPRVFITDPKALQHVMSSSVYNYPKPPGFIQDLKPLLGSGILLAEGDVHKRQRKMMNPAFSFNNVKVQ